MHATLVQLWWKYVASSLGNTFVFTHSWVLGVGVRGFTVSAPRFRVSSNSSNTVRDTDLVGHKLLPINAVIWVDFIQCPIMNLKRSIIEHIWIKKLFQLPYSSIILLPLLLAKLLNELFLLLFTLFRHWFWLMGSGRTPLRLMVVVIPVIWALIVETVLIWTLIRYQGRLGFLAFNIRNHLVLIVVEDVLFKFYMNTMVL